MSKQASQAGECWSVPSLCVGISPLCPPHPCGCTLLHGSKASPLRHPQSPPVKGLPSVWKPFLLHSSLPLVQVLSLFFCLCFSIFFCPTQVHGDFLSFWEVWGLLPAFSRCSVGVVPHVDVFLMCLWGGRCSPRLTLLPSWSSCSSFVILKLPGGCWCGATCSYNKMHKGWSSHDIGSGGETSVGTVTGSMGPGEYPVIPSRKHHYHRLTLIQNTSASLALWANAMRWVHIRPSPARLLTTQASTSSWTPAFTPRPSLCLYTNPTRFSGLNLMSSSSVKPSSRLRWN